MPGVAVVLPRCQISSARTDDQITEVSTTSADTTPSASQGLTASTAAAAAAALVRVSIQYQRCSGGSDRRVSGSDLIRSLQARAECPCTVDGWGFRGHTTISRRTISTFL